MPLKPGIAIEELGVDGGNRFGIAKHAAIESRSFSLFAMQGHQPRNAARRRVIDQRRAALSSVAEVYGTDRSSGLGVRSRGRPK
jgi:hypothetical protein